MDADAAPGHDALFRRAFSVPLVAEQFLRAWLPTGFQRLVDWSTLEVQPVAGIDPGLGERREDVVYRVRAPDRTVCFYLLLEHQSRPDRWMPLRVLEYTLLVWREHRRGPPAGEVPAATPPPGLLPLVVPVVIHPGPGRWTGPARLRDLMEMPAEIGSWADGFAPDAGFLLVELAGLELPRLAAGRLARAVLCALQAQRTGSLGFEQVCVLLEELFGEPARDQALGLAQYLWTYVLRHSELRAPDIERILDHVVPQPSRKTFMSTADMLIQMGRQEGRQEGELLALQLAVLEAFDARFGTAPDATRAAILAITDRDRLRRLLRSAIRCPGVEEFMASLPAA